MKKRMITSTVIYGLVVLNLSSQIASAAPAGIQLNEPLFNDKIIAAENEYDSTEPTVEESVVEENTRTKSPDDMEDTQIQQENEVDNKSDIELSTSSGIKVPDTIITGAWGTSNWEFNSELGELIIHTGKLTNHETSPWNSGEISAKTIKKIILMGEVIAPRDSSNLFSNSGLQNYLDELESIEGLLNLNLSSTTKTSGMFTGCKSLKMLDLSNWNTSKVTDMNNMFSFCNELEMLDLTNWDTSEVIDMSYMFYNCKALKELEISNVETKNLVTMNAMFMNCESIVHLDLSHINSAKVVGISELFSGAKSLQSVNLSNLDTRKVSQFYRLFSGCISLESVNLSSFTFYTNNTKDFFNECYRLKEITLGESTFISKENTGLPEIDTQLGKYTGRWVGASSNNANTSFESSLDFMINYNPKNLNEIGTYVWEETKSGNVIVKYQDEDSNIISDEVVLSGYVGESYTTESKEIEGYTLKEIQGDDIGQFTDATQLVIYVYKKNENPKPEIEATVITMYVDEEGTEIALRNTTIGIVGSAYTTEQKKISGYTFKEVQGNRSGKYAEGTTTVTYVYTRDKPKDPLLPIDPMKPSESGNNNANSNLNVSKIRERTLPSTGEKNFSWIVALGGLIPIAVAGFYVYNREKNY